jgi:hypothetical protein
VAISTTGNLSAVMFNFRTNQRVVFRATALTGMTTTDVYRYIPSSLVGSGPQFVVNYDAPIADSATMNYLAASSDLTFDPNAAMVFGSVFDCATPGRRVANVTVTAYVPGISRYTNPALFKIEPSATATSVTGRYVLLNVPATDKNEILVSYNMGGLATLVADLGFVPEPGVVSVVDVNPPKR